MVQKNINPSKKKEVGVKWKACYSACSHSFKSGTGRCTGKNVRLDSFLSNKSLPHPLWFFMPLSLTLFFSIRNTSQGTRKVFHKNGSDDGNKLRSESLVNKFLLLSSCLSLFFPLLQRDSCHSSFLSFFFSFRQEGFYNVQDFILLLGIPFIV